MSTVSSPNYSSQDIARIEEIIRKEAEKTRDRNDKQVDQIEKRYRADTLKQENNSQKAVDKIRDSADEAYTNQIGIYQKSLEQLKEQNYDNQGKVSGPSPYDTYKVQIEDLQKQYERIHQKDAEAIEKGVKNVHAYEQDALDKTRREIESLKNSHIEETAQLRDNIKNLNDFHAQEVKQEGETIARLDRDHENNHRSELGRQQHTYEDVINKLQSDIKHGNALNTNNTNDSLKAKDRYWTDIVSRDKAEEHTNLKAIQDHFQKQFEDSDRLRKHQGEAAQQTNEASAEATATQNSEAFRVQSTRFNEAFKDEKNRSNQEIQILGEELQKQKTSASTAEIAPAAEAALRKNVLREYEKTLRSEVDRNKQNTDRLRERDTENYQKALENFNHRIELTDRQYATQAHLEEHQSHDMLDQLQSDADGRFFSQEKSNERLKDEMTRKFSNNIEQQRKMYEHDFEIQHDDSTSKLSNFQQDAQINFRTAQRAFTRQQNELMRDYEKKLADQKSEYDNRIGDLKQQKQIDMRDLERKMRQDYDTQARSYEQRIAQIEAQTKERERFITQNYQDELDKVRRSNDLINKKKS